MKYSNTPGKVLKIEKRIFPGQEYSASEQNQVVRAYENGASQAAQQAKRGSRKKPIENPIPCPCPWYLHVKQITQKYP